ncbi:3-carboxy-cis,cis-muconate cycloisomerase [Devosia sp. LC5]|uniref:3-carboxy-cis,cis-muconate cycloisomerase n=1 Tax=Devosia sp. LC5 TaxID=1502724 RepID=UPI0004E31EB6|nr:3-carboxy-cis,cis-muconate cycloisomerase [Devosia sp. LC5]KFC68070.1 3-carboxy-cis,cis-muconate cycloisomerase [Devosia sp. LC5]
MTTLLDALTGDNAIAALLSDQAQLSHMLAFEAALAQAEAQAGLIAPEAARAIEAAIARFTPDWNDLVAGMIQDGVVIPALMRQLRGAIGPQHAAALHFGATSQDAIDTALVLQIADVITLLEQRLNALQLRLAAVAAQDGARPAMAHTRMQQALTTTIGDKLANWSEPLGRHLNALARTRRELLVIQLGGPVGDRASFDGKGDLVAKYLAQRLDLGVAPSWHAMRDPIVAFGSLLSLISGTLGKMGMDIALMAQTEIGEVRLTAGGQSSAMAHKSNPVKAELLVALARYNAGLAGTLQQAMVHENERSGAAWTLEWLTLPKMMTTSGASLRIADELLAQISFG